jgi:hypothetical protein
VFGSVINIIHGVGSIEVPAEGIPMIPSEIRPRERERERLNIEERADGEETRGAGGGKKRRQSEAVRECSMV